MLTTGSSSHSLFLSSDEEIKHTAIKDCEILFKYTVQQLNESLTLLRNGTGNHKTISEAVNNDRELSMQVFLVPA
ncbi:hypothetical protein SUGI_0004320 [Cryptomeria japonica]|nr:hypothetical protein SUGI_0004320 [Cryptomeria japonica]